MSVTVSTIQYSNAYHSIQYYYTMALILIIIIFIVIRMYLLTNVITMLMIPMQQALSPFQLPCSEYTNAHAYLIPRGLINEYTYENGVQFEIKSL